jgi:hypothetical protein
MLHIELNLISRCRAYGDYALLVTLAHNTDISLAKEEVLNA